MYDYGDSHGTGATARGGARRRRRRYRGQDRANLVPKPHVRIATSPAGALDPYCPRLTEIARPSYYWSFLTRHMAPRLNRLVTVPFDW